MNTLTSIVLTYSKNTITNVIALTSAVSHELYTDEKHYIRIENKMSPTQSSLSNWLHDIWRLSDRSTVCHMLCLNTVLLYVTIRWHSYIIWQKWNLARGYCINTYQWRKMKAIFGFRNIELIKNLGFHRRYIFPIDSILKWKG